MISKQTINSSFHYFSPNTTRRGISWMHKILALTGDKDSVTADLISAPFNPTLYLKNNKITSLVCNCGGPRYCEHLAGLLFYLQANPNAVNNLKARPNLIIEYDDDEDDYEDEDYEEEHKPYIRTGRINSYRKVLDTGALLSDLESGDYFEDDYYFDEDDFLDTNIEIYSDRDNLLNVLITREVEYFKKEDPVMIQFKWINDELFIKCLRCSHTSDELCKHQKLAMNEGDGHWIEDFIQGGMEISAQYKIFAESNSVPAHLLKRHFDIGFYGENQMYLRAKTEMLIITEKNIEKYEQSMVPANDDPAARKSLLDRMYEDDDKAAGNAILWTQDYNSVVIRYLEGRLAKDNKKLTAFIEKTDEPDKIPISLRSDLKKIDGAILDLTDKESELRMQQYLQFLQDNATRWNDHIHYLQTARYSPFHKIKKTDLHLFRFAKETFLLNLEIIEETEAILVHLKPEQPITTKNKKKFLQSFPLFYLIDEKAYVYPDISVYIFMEQEGPEMKYMLPASQKNIARRMVCFLINKYKIDPANLDNEQVQAVAISRRIIRLSQHHRRIHLHPLVEVANSELLPFNVLTELCQSASEDPCYIAIPDQKVRDQFLSWLRALHPRIDRLTAPLGFYTMHIDDFSKNQWFLDFSEACEKAGVILEGWDSLEGFSFSPYRAEIAQTVSSERDWFDIHFTIRFGDIIVPQKDWIRAVRKGEKSVLLADGTYGIIPEEWRLRMIQLLHSAEVKKEAIKLSKLQFNAIDQYVDLEHEPEILKDIEEKKERLIQFKGMKSFDTPEKVRADLRPYQKDGYNWLKFLNEYGFGGCLADDMGLGKTLQVLCLLADQKANGAPVSLVVVPRSLMHNWAAEIEKFCPDLTYLLHHGMQRSKDCKDFSSYDVIISTYGTVTNDIEWMKDHTFHYAILDESQAIKNPASRRYKSMIQLSASYKLTMTGTPVENSTMDLFAQFNFINPGLLGNKTQFRKRFADSIDKDGDMESRELLKKIVHPFLLRRTKSQVARDLPPKTESILYCEMEAKQRTIYHKMKNEIRASLLDDENLEKNKIMVLDGLLKLRQICNSPALLNGHLQSESGDHPSIKIDTLMEQIEEVVGREGHSILVFSQFTSMLTLVRQRLDREKYDYAYLDGSTTNRQAVIDAFNTDPDKKIFLISLKAGNTGLNLTKADFVYLIDPWWNPAVESQAIDRTHRIGQTNPVFAYRFICKDTIEEKVMHLQSRKNKLVEDLIQTDENVFKSLNKEELISLFE